MSGADDDTHNTFNTIYSTNDSIQDEWYTHKEDWGSFYIETKAKIEKLILDNQYPSAEYNKTMAQIKQNQYMIKNRIELLVNIFTTIDKVAEQLEYLKCIDHSRLDSKFTELYAKGKYELSAKIQ